MWHTKILLNNIKKERKNIILVSFLFDLTMCGKVMWILRLVGMVELIRDHFLMTKKIILFNWKSKESWFRGKGRKPTPERSWGRTTASIVKLAEIFAVNNFSKELVFLSFFLSHSFSFVFSSFLLSFFLSISHFLFFDPCSLLSVFLSFFHSLILFIYFIISVSLCFCLSSSFLSFFLSFLLSFFRFESVSVFLKEQNKVSQMGHTKLWRKLLFVKM